MPLGNREWSEVDAVLRPADAACLPVNLARLRAAMTEAGIARLRVTGLGADARVSTDKPPLWEHVDRRSLSARRATSGAPNSRRTGRTRPRERSFP